MKQKLTLIYVEIRCLHIIKCDNVMLSGIIVWQFRDTSSHVNKLFVLVHQINRIINPIT